MLTRCLRLNRVAGECRNASLKAVSPGVIFVKLVSPPTLRVVPKQTKARNSLKTTICRTGSINRGTGAASLAGCVVTK